MSGPEEIISDEEIIRVHGYANFGSMTPREVVNDGVRKYAVGFTGGSTQVAILREHGLITAPRGAGYRANLTEKGKRYARSIYNTRTPDPAQIRADALREAADCLRGLGYGTAPRTILALLDTTLSPTAVDVSPAPDAGGKDDPAVYLIRKYGGYYRPNCQGYTRFKEDAGRYTLAKAIRESHPNGPDGPRDGMTYIHEDDVGPLDAGGKESV